MRVERGFTLIEAVVGMVALAIALTLLSTLLFPLAERSADAFVRAQQAQVGKAVLAELAGRRFDQATPDGGGKVANISCCDSDGSLCPGPGSNPSEWQNLDSFHNYHANAEALLDGAHYNRFMVSITITCPTLSAWEGGAKALNVTVTGPSGEAMQFSQMRGNF